MKHLAVISISLLALMSISSAQTEELKVPEFATELERLNIFDSFKGFSMGHKELNEDGNKLDLEFLLLDDKNFRIHGIQITVERKTGKLQAINPILVQREVEEATYIMSWAFDQFHEDNISFDSLWQILRSAIGKEHDDKQVFILIFSGTSTHDDKEFPILDGGPVQNALNNNGLNQYIKDNMIRIRDLGISLLE